MYSNKYTFVIYDNVIQFSRIAMSSNTPPLFFAYLERETLLGWTFNAKEQRSYKKQGYH